MSPQERIAALIEYSKRAAAFIALLRDELRAAQAVVREYEEVKRDG